VTTGNLYGYALPAQYAPIVDHTYVTSDDGHTWGCHGRSAGGHLICSGRGNVPQADCLAQQNGEAGIVYKRTGVCHQIANRILFPAGATVSSARGARASFFRWGVYGLDSRGCPCDPELNPWLELRRCLEVHQHEPLL